MSHRIERPVRPLFSWHTLISLSLITLLTGASVVLCLVSVSAPCTVNYYEFLPLYPDARVTEAHTSILNYLAVGDLSHTLLTTDDLATVEAWYHDNVEVPANEAGRLRALNQEAPEVWQHDYRITETQDGVEIYLRGMCYR